MSDFSKVDWSLFESQFRGCYCEVHGLEQGLAQWLGPFAAVYGDRAEHPGTRSGTRGLRLSPAGAEMTFDSSLKSSIGKVVYNISECRCQEIHSPGASAPGSPAQRLKSIPKRDSIPVEPACLCKDMFSCNKEFFAIGGASWQMEQPFIRIEESQDLSLSGFNKIILLDGRNI